jgi:hypothetical protein
MTQVTLGATRNNDLGFFYTQGRAAFSDSSVSLISASLIRSRSKAVTKT